MNPVAVSCACILLSVSYCSHSDGHTGTTIDTLCYSGDYHSMIEILECNSDNHDIIEILECSSFFDTVIERL